MKKFLIDCLIALITILIGLTISRTFTCGMVCGIIYYFITLLVDGYLKEREEK